jgi:hypothetical protein
MAWICLEGKDRSGKSTVAKMYEAQGYKYVHFSAPDRKYTQRGYTGPSYLDDTLELLISLSGQNVVFDRSAYGELVWPQVYGRSALLTDEDLTILREIEDYNDTVRILMRDPDVEAHWQRCVSNKEQLTRSEFNSADQLYDAMAQKYNFSVKSLSDFKMPEEKKVETKLEPVIEDKTNVVQMETIHKLTPEQLKLQQANAINDVLSSRVIKKKGSEYDLIESRIRKFLNGELAMLLGIEKQPTHQPLPFSSEEITLLKALANRVKDKRA